MSMKNLKKLSARHIKFCDTYLLTGSTSKASDAIGVRHPYGSNLLKDPLIKEYIEGKNKELSQKTAVDREMLRKRFYDVVNKYIKGIDELTEEDIESFAKGKIPKRLMGLVSFDVYVGENGKVSFKFKYEGIGAITNLTSKLMGEQGGVGNESGITDRKDFEKEVLGALRACSGRKPSLRKGSTENTTQVRS